LPQVIEEYPQQHPAQQKMNNEGKSEKPASSGNSGIGFVSQTCGTQHSVFMFGHTFATEIPPALRAAGNRFPQYMIVTSLMQ